MLVSTTITLVVAADGLFGVVRAVVFFFFVGTAVGFLVVVVVVVVDVDVLVGVVVSTVGIFSTSTVAGVVAFPVASVGVTAHVETVDRNASVIDGLRYSSLLGFSKLFASISARTSTSVRSESSRLV